MRVTGVFHILAAALLLSLATASPAPAQSRSLGSFQDWTAYVDGTGGGKLCYMGASPQKAQGDYTRRGPIFFLVSHRPGNKVFGEVSVETGYTYKSGSEATATIDGARTFKLFTRGENAWNYDAAADRTMVQAMRAGLQMVIKGTSSRGTATTDTYSLKGFTAAYDAISKACDAP
jgi:invasion protein IalB